MSDLRQLRQKTSTPNRRFSDNLSLLAETIEGERVDIAAIVRAMGERSMGALLVFLALPMVLPVPAPGISVAFGIPLIFISAQLVMGRRQIWLPKRLARYSMSRADFCTFVARALPALRGFESVIRPRFCWLAGDWAIVPIGIICLVLATIITLPVPLGHMLPGAAICLLALGLTERDGLAIALGIATAAIAAAAVIFASRGLAIWFRALVV